MNRLLKHVCLIIPLLANSAYANTYGDCGIKDVALKKLEKANELDKQQYESLQQVAQKKPSEFTCLPTLEKLGSALNATQFSLTGLAIDAIAMQIKNVACKITDNYIEDLAEQANVSWDVPYGVGDVGIGVTDKYKDVDIGDELSDAINRNTDIKGDLSSDSPVNIRDVTGSRRDEAEGIDDESDWFDEL